MLLGELAEQCIDIEQRLIHHPFAAADLDQRDSGVGAVASFGGGLDGGEVHAVAVAVAEEERVLDVCPRFQPVGVVAEELARAADQGDLAVQQHGVQLGGQAVAVELLVCVGDLGKKAALEHGRDSRVFQVDARLEVERVDHALDARGGGHLGLDRPGQRDHVVGERLAEALGARRAGADVGAHVAGGPLHEDALGGQLGFDLVLEEAGVVGRVLEDLRVGHDRVRGEVDEDGDRLAFGVVEADDGQHRVGDLRLALGVPVAVQVDRLGRDADPGGLPGLVGVENGLDQETGAASGNTRRRRRTFPCPGRARRSAR